jgi:hypothetical protein
LLLTHSSFAQEKYNYFAIDKIDTQEDIVRKAGNGVSSKDSLNGRKFQEYFVTINKKINIEG